MHGSLNLLVLLVAFLFGLFFDPEDGGDTFPRNFWVSQNYFAL
jgi:hypothetical protein